MAPNVKVGDRLTVIKEGGYFIHPITEKEIKKEDENVAQLIVKETFDGYSLTAVMNCGVVARFLNPMNGGTTT